MDRQYIVICNLPTIVLDKLYIYNLGKSIDYTLDGLAQDLTMVFKNPTTSKLYMQCIVRDYVVSGELLSEDVDQHLVTREIHDLIRDITIRLRSLHISNVSFIRLELELPDKVTFIFNNHD